jgi:hypothetical protein
MNIRLATLCTVFVAFSILTFVAVSQYGYIGIFEAGLRDSASMQVFFDLIISVSLFGIWMLVDARKRGTTVWPYLLAIPAVGSVSPLVYLIVREWRAANPRQAGSSKRLAHVPAR